MDNYCYQCKHYVTERIGANGGERGYCIIKDMARLAVHPACKKHYEDKYDQLPNNSKDAP